MRRTERLADPNQPDDFEDEADDLRPPAINAARPAPPPKAPPPRRQLDASPRDKLAALRHQRDTLRAVVAVHDARIQAAQHAAAVAERSIAEYENEPIQRKPENCPGWMASLAKRDQARAEIQRETEASRELRADLTAAETLLRRLDAYERTYGVRDPQGDPSKRVLVKVTLGTVSTGGRKYRPGETFETDEPSALRLADRGFVEIKRN